jgi:S-formylglutathione hydrolase FrmB
MAAFDTALKALDMLAAASSMSPSSSPQANSQYEAASETKPETYFSPTLRSKRTRGSRNVGNTEKVFRHLKQNNLGISNLAQI